MSAAVTPARRLLALLGDEPSLETRPRDEVDADLAALGIDSAGPIRLARRLAEESAGPAVALLGAAIEDESMDAEIAALESADIDEVRSRLQAGTVAAVTAEAKRRAGLQSNVVGIARHRRGAVWAWTGSLVGMAACALIVVAAWWPPSNLTEGIMPAEISTAVPDVAHSEPTFRREDGSARMPDAMSMSAPTTASEADAQVVPPEPRTSQSLVISSIDGRPAVAESIEAEGASDEAAAKVGETEELPPDGLGAMLQSPAGALGRPMQDAEPPLPPSVPAERRSAADAAIAEESAPSAVANLGEDGIADNEMPGVLASPTLESADAAMLSRESLGDRVAVPTDPSIWVGPVTVTDLLIVDSAATGLEPVLMPGRALALLGDGRADDGLETGPLSDRMAAARLSAAGRPIVAVLRLRSANTGFDAVLVRRAAGERAPNRGPTRSLLVDWFGEQAEDYGLIALPPR